MKMPRAALMLTLLASLNSCVYHVGDPTFTTRKDPSPILRDTNGCVTIIHSEGCDYFSLAIPIDPEFQSSPVSVDLIWYDSSHHFWFGDCSHIEEKHASLKGLSGFIDKPASLIHVGCLYAGSSFGLSFGGIGPVQPQFIQEVKVKFDDGKELVFTKFKHREEVEIQGGTYYRDLRE